MVLPRNFFLGTMDTMFCGSGTVAHRDAGWRRLERLLIIVALFSVAAVGNAEQQALPKELSTGWEVPPGDPLELMTAGFAKILCSALFVTGRDLATAIDEDGFFVSPRAERHAVAKMVVDPKVHAVHLTLTNGVTRTARLYGDQGCVTLPRGADSGLFHSGQSNIVPV